MQQFLVKNFNLYLLLISICSFFLVNYFEKIRSNGKGIKFVKLLIVSFIIFAVWFTRKMYIESYMPPILSEEFSV
jgi:hypothetical protein